VGHSRRGVGGPGGWWILDEPELHFGNDVLVPDVAGWRRERMPSLPSTAYFSLPPDWICEVISHSSEKLDRLRKMPIYAKAGIEHAWLIHPIARTLEVLGLELGKWRLLQSRAKDAAVQAPPFEAVTITLSDLWA